MLQAPALVTVMVAGSDGDYNEKEVERGLDVTWWKKFHSRPDLDGFYEEVGQRYQSDIALLRRDLPKDVNERYRIISERLQQLNPILYKLEKPLAEQYYASLQELAKQVAEANGGVLGYLSVGYNESKVITLPMIDDPRTFRV
ncbi:hypothetical protein D770_03400 [Flammeovirgaceae bacterium 311]|nr:hypothetical protein D770_03400 [Flammeovirgaceae bacterium 311]